ncbi:MAG: CHAD domain-containing protein [Acidobacteria bacterium]|nr:CHAD domain-containing protein [Acidobacteriota bacterium]
MKSAVETFARMCLNELLDESVYWIRQTANLRSEEAVHQLRVSLRRLQQGLRVFAKYLPRRGLSRVRKQVRTLLQAAAEVRSRDIAAQLIVDLGGDPAPLLVERKTAMKDLLQLASRDAADSVKWRKRLDLR